jgi:hypothetical protein
VNSLSYNKSGIQCFLQWPLLICLPVVRFGKKTHLVNLPDRMPHKTTPPNQAPFNQPPTNYPFLTGGGEMGALTRTFDWSKTALGKLEQWPQSLRTIVNMLLNARSPMFLWWGPS